MDITIREHYEQAMVSLSEHADAPDVAAILPHLQALVEALPPDEQYRVLGVFLATAMMRLDTNARLARIHWDGKIDTDTRE